MFFNNLMIVGRESFHVCFGSFCLALDEEKNLFKHGSLYVHLGLIQSCSVVSVFSEDFGGNGLNSKISLIHGLNSSLDCLYFKNLRF